MWLVTMSANIGQITAENGHTDRNKLLKIYFAYLCTLSQRLENKTLVTERQVYLILLMISLTEIFPLENEVYGC
jgi:hypothetical protein